MSDWIYLGIFFLAITGLIGITELTRKRMRWQPEMSRKTVHILTGLMVASTPFLFNSPTPLFIIGVIFTLVNFSAVKLHLLKGMHGTGRQTYGTVFYPIAFIILVALLWNTNRLILVAAMLILALADAMAAIVGRQVKKPRVYFLGREKKSLQGSLAMLLTSAAIIVLCFVVFRDFNPVPIPVYHIVWIAILVSIVTTACEAISIQGSDNLTVPLGAAFALHYLIYHPVSDTLAFTFGLVLSVIVAVSSYRLRFLDLSGAGVTFLLATVVFGVGRWMFSLPILAFFLISSLLSRMGKKRKQKLQNVFEKSGTRDLGQVLANGGVAGALVILWNYFPVDLVFILFLGSLAAVTADTWATEIGVMARAVPRSILTWKKIPTGTSGGITVLGTSGALVGAMVIAAVGWLSGHRSPAIVGSGQFVLLALSGLLASMVDSLLGATVQAQYQCRKCGKITEKKLHCNNLETAFVKGYRWINNDVVNGFSAISGVLFVYLGYQLFF